MTKTFTTPEIESALCQLTQQKNAVVSTLSLCNFLGGDVNDKELDQRLMHFLEGDDTLYTIDDENFFKRSDFFNGKTFVLTPTADEIARNILIIGHRFQTFMNPEIFPSELTLKYGRKNIAKKLITEKLEDIFPYHLLMGAEQISDFFVGEDDANAHWKSKAPYALKIRFNVLDMTDFYRENDFKVNDALMMEIKDYDKGIFKVSFAGADERDENVIKKWCNDFEDEIAKVADKYETYLDLPEQLRMAFFGGGKRFFGKDGASLDEFIRNAENVEIVFDSDHTVMMRKNDSFDSEASIPEDISISSGDSSSLGAILKSAGSSLTETEVDSFILESCFDRDKDFNSFLTKVFDFDKLNFSDEAQKIVFLNFLEERFEHLSENYNRFNDEEKAPLRSRILELTNARNDFFNYIKALDIDEKNIPQDEMKKIAAGTMHLNSILQMLNDERHDLSEDEKDAIFEAVESAEDILNDSMETLEIALKI